jgi:hypothetical protein
MHNSACHEEHTGQHQSTTLALGAGTVAALPPSPLLLLLLPTAQHDA